MLSKQPKKSTGIDMIDIERFDNYLMSSAVGYLWPTAMVALFADTTHTLSN